jgi:hypothetical protein
VLLSAQIAAQSGGDNVIREASLFPRHRTEPRPTTRFQPGIAEERLVP